MTVVQVLIVVAVIGILLGLLLPAIQRARATARTVQCKDNLRQLGVATQTYTSSGRAFPRRMMDLLPHIEQTPLYHRLVEFETKVKATGAAGISHAELGSVTSFTCPVDGVPLPFATYFLNDGTKFRVTSADYPDPNGIAPPFVLSGSEFLKKTPVSGVTDGLSQTALYSERIQSTSNLFRVGERPHPERRLSWPLPGTVNTPEELHSRYLQQTNWPLAASPDELLNRISKVGSLDIISKYAHYNHVLPPNTRPVFAEPSLSTPSPISKPATSFHRAGVNVAFCDGHVQFISDAIDIEVWRAIGTRNGKEVISGDSF